MCTKPRKFKGAIVPCGQCMECRIKRTAEWATRILHERDYHENAYFVTLTYNNENLPKTNSLDRKAVPLFIKNFRKNREAGTVKYFSCGEYGSEEKTLRPHYHVIMFTGASVGGDDPVLREIEDAWEHKGFCYLGTVTYQSARYVASYVIKKINGEKAKAHYQGREPEFVLTSKGLGLRYAMDNYEQILNRGYITQDGVKLSIPRYYVKKLDIDTSVWNQEFREEQHLLESKLINKYGFEELPEVKRKSEKQRELTTLAKLSNKGNKGLL